MTTTAAGIPSTIHLDLDLARQDLARAKAAQRAKDTVAARARVQACRARLDTILDIWNAGGRAAS